MQRGHAHRQLAGPGLEQHALGADHITDVVTLECLIGRLAQLVAGDKELDAPAHVLEVGEARLAHDALGHHAPGDPHRARRGLEALRCVIVVGVQQLRGKRITTEVVGEGPALCTQGGEFGAPLGDQRMIRVIHLTTLP